MHRTQVLLNHTLEKTVARQAADLSLLAEERFRQEFESLALAAELLAASPNKIEEERIFSGLRGSEKNVSVGILSVQGEALSGSYISRRSFLGLPHAFRGQNVVDYSSRDGLLFAVPYLIVGYDVLWGAMRNILHGQVFDEKFLMAVATLGAFAIQEYPEAAAVMGRISAPSCTGGTATRCCPTGSA